MGARVIVTEVDPLPALEAAMEGFTVMPLRDAARIGDVFVTVTGDTGVVRSEHLEVMKDGAILANSGHFDVEIDKRALADLAESRRRIREYVDEYRLPDGRRLRLLAEGRLVNLAAAEGCRSSGSSSSEARWSRACTRFRRTSTPRSPGSSCTRWVSRSTR
jgi:adenosylhomocysteinase